ncbi:lysozyme g [Gadus morhua]|uniref:lysozyme g n=1 Tax=Gadus morhua TaxID=8049 RepID=UPI0011B7FCB7|nr:lysozyme g-like [Gadus morhua]
MGYGDIMTVITEGASDHTAKAYGKELRAGVPASQKMAKDDLGNMETYKTIIENVAKRHDVDPALIAGIISRESEAGHSIKNTDPPGWGDNYNAFGLMQVDKRWHKPRGAWDSETHLDQGTGILVDLIKHVQKERPNWSTNWQLKGAIAAYNKGYKVLDHPVHNMDQITTGGDYSSDVVARAQWYKENLFKAGILENIVSFFWP